MSQGPSLTIDSSLNFLHSFTYNFSHCLHFCPRLQDSVLVYSTRIRSIPKPKEYEGKITPSVLRFVYVLFIIRQSNSNHNTLFSSLSFVTPFLVVIHPISPLKRPLYWEWESGFTMWCFIYGHVSDFLIVFDFHFW